MMCWCNTGCLSSLSCLLFGRSFLRRRHIRNVPLRRLDGRVRPGIFFCIAHIDTPIVLGGELRASLHILVGELEVDWANFFLLLLLRFFFVRVFFFVLFDRLRQLKVLSLFIYVFDVFWAHLRCREWLVDETTLVQL